MTSKDEVIPGIDLKIGRRHIIMTSCHKIPERSFHFRGKPLLCYRCLGLNGGFFLFLFIQSFLFVWRLFSETNYNLLQPIEKLSGNQPLLTFGLIIVTQLPFAIDGTMQAISMSYESNNLLRFITGILGGYGQFVLFFFLGQLTRDLLLS